MRLAEAVRCLGYNEASGAVQKEDILRRMWLRGWKKYQKATEGARRLAKTLAAFNPARELVGRTVYAEILKRAGVNVACNGASGC